MPLTNVPKLMIAADQPDADRQLPRKKPPAFARLAGWNSFFLKTRPRAPVCEISTNRFGTSVLPGSCRSMAAEAALHLPELRLVRIEVLRHAVVLFSNWLRKSNSSALGLLQNRPVVVPDEHVPGEGPSKTRKISSTKKPRTAQRPAADVRARIESTKLVDEIHFAATFLTVVWAARPRGSRPQYRQTT